MTERFVTFDVWDTLLRRRCDPLCVKLFTCRALVLLHWDRLDPRWRDAWRVLQRRHTIEFDRVRVGRSEGHDGEYRLDAVLEALVRQVCRDATPDADVSRIAAELSQIEIAQERCVTYDDADIADVIAAQGDARLAFLSDFHLPSPVVAELLRAHGFAQVARDGIVSCDVGLSKKSGRLFEHARQALAIGSASWLHVGDDAHADGHAAARLGIATLMHLPAEEAQRRRRRERLFGRPRLAIAEACRRLLESDMRDGPSHLEARIKGAGVAPLMCGFMLWVMEEGLKRRASRIRFLGRGCDLLADVHRVVAGIHSDVLPMPDMSSRHADDGRRTLDVSLAAFPDLQRSAGASNIGQLSLACCIAAGGAENYLGAATKSISTNALRQRLDLIAGISMATDEAAAFRESLLTACETLTKELRTHAVSSADMQPFALAAWRHGSGSGPAGWGVVAMPEHGTWTLRGALAPAVTVPMRIRVRRSLSRIKRRLQRAK
jgi:FMN phosphatase YigB (HAD superfamily)